MLIPLGVMDLLGAAPDATHDTRVTADPDGTMHIQRVPRPAPPPADDSDLPPPEEPRAA